MRYLYPICWAVLISGCTSAASSSDVPTGVELVDGPLNQSYAVSVAAAMDDSVDGWALTASINLPVGGQEASTEQMEAFGERILAQDCDQRGGRLSSDKIDGSALFNRRAYEWQGNARVAWSMSRYCLKS